MSEADETWTGSAIPNHTNIHNTTKRRLFLIMV